MVGSYIGVDVGRDGGTFVGTDVGFNIGWNDGLPGVIEGPGVDTREGTGVGGVVRTIVGFAGVGASSFGGKVFDAIVDEAAGRGDNEMLSIDGGDNPELG
jgi:hypothetical protein